MGEKHYQASTCAGTVNIDMALNDEEDSLSDTRHKRIEAASRLGGLMPEPSGTEMNGFQPRDCNVAVLSVKLESTSAEPLNYLRRRDEYSHGSGCEEQIYRLFRNGNGWRDSICTLFQAKGLQTCEVEIPGAGGSCAVAVSLEFDPSSSKVDLENRVSLGYAVKEKAFREAPQSLQNVTGRFPSAPEHQENKFQEMGFPPALIQRAILLHGGQADDSIILQFLLDWRENNDVLRANFLKQPDPCEANLPNYNEIKTSEENISDHSAMRQQLKKTGDEQLWDREYCADTDFDDYEEASPPKQGLPSYWTDERGSDYPVTSRERKLPFEGGYHHLLINYGFAAEVVQMALQELGLTRVLLPLVSGFKMWMLCICSRMLSNLSTFEAKSYNRCLRGATISVVENGIRLLMNITMI